MRTPSAKTRGLPRNTGLTFPTAADQLIVAAGRLVQRVLQAVPGLNSGLILETDVAHGEFIRFHELCL